MISSYQTKHTLKAAHIELAKKRKLAMKSNLKAIITVAGLTLFANAAIAQDYNNWGVIDPYGLQQMDQWGNIHYTNPYAYDSQVDAYGNVISSDGGMMDSSPDYYELTPVQPSGYYGSSGSTSSTYVPYPNTTDSHKSFINSIWD